MSTPENEADAQQRRPDYVSAGVAAYNALVVIVIALSLRLPIFSPGVYHRGGVVDIGDVEPDTTSFANFPVRNLHPWPITITNVAGGCACLNPVVGRQLPCRLRPFEALMIQADVSSTGKRGTVNVPIDVYVDGRPETRIQVRLSIRPRKGAEL